ncbi:sensor histidine kinase [Alkalicoccus luteus]|uniref:histidine kinase n=1 Tax=Alkalicoccus luteus TaxID=1237094 RepID=A0A969PQ46_9BACI|nr:ATP-binding protein [Alkalicoccus luteus]NJP38336.1 two-component sensor histidine kinase [Alkalicoccus luteus]
MDGEKRTWSLRAKIMAVLLLLTGLLVSLSFFFIQSLGEIHDVSESITEDQVPELVWLSHWESQVLMKEQYIQMGIQTDFCCGFIEGYESFRDEGEASMREAYGPPPAQLEPANVQLQRLDFLVFNQVSGLLDIGNEAEAASLLETDYMDELETFRVRLAAERTQVTEMLETQQGRFTSIIQESLDLLVLTAAAVFVLALVAAYRISSGLTRPVNRLQRELHYIAEGNYGEQISGVNQPELIPLAHSVNKLSEQLKRSFDLLILDKMYREQILDSLPVGVVTSDEKRGEIRLNKTARDVLGAGFNKDELPELAARQDGMQNFWKLLSSKEIFQNEKVFVTNEKEEEQIFLCSQAELVNEHRVTIGKLFYFIDITDTEALEQQVQHTEKLALVGSLAAGAAHEIRNPLAVIDGFLKLMQQSLPEEERERFRLELLLKEITRINGIIEDMLLLAKPRDPSYEELILEDVVEEIMPLVERTAETKNIAFTLDMERVPVQADPDQIKQIFHNLIRNSAEAMDGKGKISIFGQRRRNLYCVEFVDDGPGIPDSTQEQLFSPFTTTKKNGTGLGLPIAERMMDNHQGSIYLMESQQGKTLFCLEFPLEEGPYEADDPRLR